jgi:hypothetical protein
MFAPQTNPASPAVFMCRKPKRNSYLLCVILGMFTIAPSYASRSTDFSAPLRLFANLDVRVYVSIVAGGSLTTKIVSNIKPSYKDGVSTHIFR